jgi:hypothetical protein
METYFYFIPEGNNYTSLGVWDHLIFRFEFPVALR